MNRGFRAFFFMGSYDHQIVSPYGEIISPNYPAAYPNNLNCSWLFTTTPGHRIKLVFNDFELESQESCDLDRIVAYDGASDESPILGKFCDIMVPPPIQTSGNSMYLVFTSDGSLQRKGFKAIHTTVCGGHLLAHHEVELLYSHVKFGDENYENNTDCDWIVQGINNQRVELRFQTFEVDQDKDCGLKDYVEVYDGKNDTAMSFGKFCGNTVPPEIVSSGNSLMVRFKSDEAVNAKGFSAAYSALASPV